MGNSLECKRGIVAAKKDLRHLREIVSNKHQLKIAILRYIEHKVEVEKQGPEFMSCYRATMNHLWLRYLPGSQYRTSRLPGLKLREDVEIAFSRAIALLENYHG